MGSIEGESRSLDDGSCEVCTPWTVKAVCLTQKMPLDPFFLRAKDLRASTQSILQCFQGLINSFYNSILLCQFKPTLISDLRSRYCIIIFWVLC